MPYPDNFNPQSFKRAWGSSTDGEDTPTPYEVEIERIGNLLRILNEQTQMMAERVSIHIENMRVAPNKEIKEAFDRITDQITDTRIIIQEEARNVISLLRIADEQDEEAI